MNPAKTVSAVKKWLIPSPQEEKKMLSAVKPLVRVINTKVREGKAILGGSGAKGTWLKSFDVDVFVQFPYARYAGKSDQLSEILEKRLRKSFPRMERIHGSRDYFKITEEGMAFEVVPILKIAKASQAKNITDVSPLHSVWVKKRRKLANEMRLAKQFCKANNLYGAESHIRGFSGYVCEVLVAHYGSFLALLKASAAWKEGEVIDTEGFYRKGDVKMEMNASKLISPLIIVDPVQHDRNAAAALSKEKFAAFIGKAREFLKKPSEEFFVEKRTAVEDLRKKFPGKHMVALSIMPVEGKEDVVGSKMVKVIEHIRRELGRHGFPIDHSDWEWNYGENAFAYFVFAKKQLSDMVERTGPPMSAKQHVAAFKKAHRKTVVKKGKIIAIEKRRYVRPIDCIADAAKHPYVRERCAFAAVEVV